MFDNLNILQNVLTEHNLTQIHNPIDRIGQ